MIMFSNKFMIVRTHSCPSCIDLVSVPAVYHTKCLTNFSLSSQTDSNAKNSIGRPADQQMHDAFQKTCLRFESADRPKSFRELQDFMRAEAGDEHKTSLN